MAGMAERLPVAFVMEELAVATVRNAVIHAGGRRVPWRLGREAQHAKRILGKERRR